MPQRTIYLSPRALGEAPRPPAVETRDLARLFAGRAAIAGVSLRIDGGRMVALYGPNGAGKTTLLRVLATALRPSFGQALVDGIDVATFPDEVRRRIAFLSHAGGLYDDLTAAENLRFAATLLGITDDARSQAIDSALARVGLASDAGRRVRGFSAGMRRRLALARLLLVRPSLLLLDEPYASVDAAGADLVDEMLGEWREAGTSIVIASHADDRLDSLVDGSVRLVGGVAVEVRGTGVQRLTPAPSAGVGIPAGEAPVGETR